MHKRTTPKVFKHAKELHRNMTPAESRLWARLRAHRMQGVHFRNQHAIGNYVVDFCAPRRKIIIELDGSQHLEQEEYDAERTAFLESKGYRVLRFWNNDVMNDIEGVLQAIAMALESESPNLEIMDTHN
jgi:very-short-patch-repair endonuclease